MRKQIQTIELNLENLETIIIHRQHIGHFEVIDIAKNLQRESLTSITERVRAKELFIQLSSATNNMDSYIDSAENDTPFERIIRHNDITSISINYEDGFQEEISFYWVVSNNGNSLQTSVKNDSTGDLYIAISDTDNVQSYFKEEINDARTPSLWRSLKEH